jgi:hypothetical protein
MRTTALRLNTDFTLDMAAAGPSSGMGKQGAGQHIKVIKDNKESTLVHGCISIIGTIQYKCLGSTRFYRSQTILERLTSAVAYTFSEHAHLDYYHWNLRR